MQQTKLDCGYRSILNRLYIYTLFATKTISERATDDSNRYGDTSGYKNRCYKSIDDITANPYEGLSSFTLTVVAFSLI